MTFKEACRQLGLSSRLRIVPRAVDPHQQAMQAARAAFSAWQDEQAAHLHSQRRILDEARRVAELMYRISRKFPHLFSPDEQAIWIRKLAAVYDRLTACNIDLDILVDTEELHERFALWREDEVRYGK